jgi:hypothetical protein
LADGSKLEADGQLARTPSQTVDTIAVVLSADGCKALLKAAAVQFVMDAFGHLKAIVHTPEAKPPLDKAGIGADVDVTDLGDAAAAAAGKRFFDRESQSAHARLGCILLRSERRRRYTGARKSPPTGRLACRQFPDDPNAVFCAKVYCER